MRPAWVALCLALAGCYGTQIYPTLQEQRISLARTARDLIARLP